ENALSALLLAALICNVFADVRGNSRSLFVGFLCGLLLLARIAPASMMYVAIALVLLRGRKQKLLALGACLSPVIIWGVISQSYFGHVLPMSMLVKVSSPSHLSAYHSVKPGLLYFWESAKYS